MEGKHQESQQPQPQPTDAAAAHNQTRGPRGGDSQPQAGNQQSNNQQLTANSQQKAASRSLISKWPVAARIAVGFENLSGGGGSGSGGPRSPRGGSSGSGGPRLPAPLRAAGNSGASSSAPEVMLQPQGGAVPPTKSRGTPAGLKSRPAGSGSPSAPLNRVVSSGKGGLREWDECNVSGGAATAAAASAPSSSESQLSSSFPSPFQTAVGGGQGGLVVVNSDHQEDDQLSAHGDEQSFAHAAFRRHNDPKQGVRQVVGRSKTSELSSSALRHSPSEGFAFVSSRGSRPTAGTMSTSPYLNIEGGRSTGRSSVQSRISRLMEGSGIQSIGGASQQQDEADATIGGPAADPRRGQRSVQMVKVTSRSRPSAALDEGQGSGFHFAAAAPPISPGSMDRANSNPLDSKGAQGGAGEVQRTSAHIAAFLRLKRSIQPQQRSASHSSSHRRHHYPQSARGSEDVGSVGEDLPLGGGVLEGESDLKRSSSLGSIRSSRLSRLRSMGRNEDLVSPRGSAEAVAGVEGAVGELAGASVGGEKELPYDGGTGAGGGSVHVPLEWQQQEGVTSSRRQRSLSSFDQYANLDDSVLQAESSYSYRGRRGGGGLQPSSVRSNREEAEEAARLNPLLLLNEEHEEADSRGGGGGGGGGRGSEGEGDCSPAGEWRDYRGPPPRSA